MKKLIRCVVFDVTATRKVGDNIHLCFLVDQRASNHHRHFDTTWIRPLFRIFCRPRDLGSDWLMIHTKPEVDNKSQLINSEK